jgi:erythritol transport system ATP-binding protein
MSPETVLAARAVSMQYPGTRALDAVDFAVRRGEVRVLVGENGAGKSTLMRILAGIEQPTSGVLDFLGCTPDSVAMIHQELNLLPNLSVSDNIFLAHELTRFGGIDRRAQQRRTAELMARLEQHIDPQTLVGDLPLGKQQIVEVAKALARDARVLIMDEPTSALSAPEVEVLFRLIRDLKSHGVAVVYISHRLEELLTIGDSVTVLRDGRVVAEAAAADIDVRWIVEQMCGATAAAEPVDAAESNGDSRPPVLAVKGAVSFTAAPGEIVGFYGLMGAGRTELFESMLGLRTVPAVSIDVGGRSFDRLAIQERIRSGLALVPEERKASGIVPTLSVEQNMTLAALHGVWLSPAAERSRAARLAEELHIRTRGVEAPITSLSGGNQQKAILGRYLLLSPKVLLLDEPTRGVDVGARAEIYAIIRRLAAKGMAILFASSELQEIRALATRVVVMATGRIAADFSAAEATEQALVAASTPKGDDFAYR